MQAKSHCSSTKPHCSPAGSCSSPAHCTLAEAQPIGWNHQTPLPSPRAHHLGAIACQPIPQLTSQTPLHIDRAPAQLLLCRFDYQLTLKFASLWPLDRSSKRVDTSNFASCHVAAVHQRYTILSLHKPACAPVLKASNMCLYGGNALTHVLEGTLLYRLDLHCSVYA